MTKMKARFSISALRPIENEGRLGGARLCAGDDAKYRTLSFGTLIIIIIILKPSSV
jgi:hypothetical protein